GAYLLPGEQKRQGTQWEPGTGSTSSLGVERGRRPQGGALFFWPSTATLRLIAARPKGQARAAGFGEGGPVYKPAWRQALISIALPTRAASCGWRGRCCPG